MAFIFGVIDIFPAFHQLNLGIKMAALMLPLLHQRTLSSTSSSSAVTDSEIILRKKQILVWTDAVSRTIEDHKLFKKTWIHA